MNPYFLIHCPGGVPGAASPSECLFDRFSVRQQLFSRTSLSVAAGDLFVFNAYEGFPNNMYVFAGFGWTLASGG
jgi:hypothetical protein